MNEYCKINCPYIEQLESDASALLAWEEANAMLTAASLEQQEPYADHGQSMQHCTGPVAVEELATWSLFRRGNPRIRKYSICPMRNSELD